MLQHSTSRNHRISESNNGQRGYLLMTLMLAFALMSLVLLAVLPAMKQQIQRDREEEMCRRGTQYMRAIQGFYRRLGRYPGRIEDLESTDNMRFLRKRYKDPLMKDAEGHDKEFKLLHVQDVMLNNGPGQGVGQDISSANGGGSTLDAWKNALHGNADTPDSSDVSDTQDSNPDSSATPNSSSSGGNKSASSGNSVFNMESYGGAILGVASTSKEKTIREFNKQNHYNDWYFIYDATALRRAGLLIGPWQPMSMGNTGGVGQPIAQGQQGQAVSQLGPVDSGQPQSGFGQTGLEQGLRNAPAQNGNPPQ